MFAGHIKVLGGPHVAGGPDTAQAWCRTYIEFFKTLKILYENVLFRFVFDTFGQVVVLAFQFWSHIDKKNVYESFGQLFWGPMFVVNPYCLGWDKFE